MRLRLMLFNVQDFFLKLAYPLSPADLDGLNELEWQHLAPTDLPLKPLAKIRGIAQVFAEVQPDVALLCETGGMESLVNFSRLFLGDAYEALATPPVSERGIDPGFLVRRGLGLATELVSHADEPTPFLYPHEADPAGYEVTAQIAASLPLGSPSERRLSRDVPELRLSPGPGQEPTLILLLAHLKSAFDPDGIDPLGATRRAAEMRALLKIREDVGRDFGGRAPVVVAGDLNGRAARPDTDPEFADLYLRTDLVDALELAGRPPHERVSHITYYFSGPTRGGPMRGHSGQLDYIFLPRSLHGRLDASGTYVHRYRFESGDGTIEFPGSMRERRQLPSDHYPLVVTLDL